MQARKSQRSVLALVITCALILGFGIPLIPLVGVDSAEGTEVSAASDVATVSAENSLQNGSFEQPAVYQYRETSDVPYWKSTTTSGNIEIGSVFKNGNGDNGSLHMRTGEKVAAAEGSQFGKPATSNGNYSIYQRLATTQGAKYRWSLKHRARPSGSKSGFDTLAVITADTHGAEPPSFSWGGGTDLFHNMFEWMATVGTARLDLPRQRRLQPVHAQRMERIRRRIRGGRRRHRIRAGVYNTLNGNLAYGNLVDDVSVAAEGGDGGNLVTNGGFESPSLTKDGETGSANAPANAATQRPAPRITPPIGRIASPSQSANKRRLASLTGSVIALPYFVPRKSVPGNKMRKGNDRRYPFCSRLTILRIFGGMCVKKDGKTGDLYPLPCFAAPSFAHDCAKPA